MFHDGCAKRGTFPIKILNKNSLSLAHCALNRSFTVFTIYVLPHSSSIMSGRGGGGGGVLAGGWVAGKSLPGLYLRNHKVKEVDTW